jgi:hypothetical protein
MWNPFRKKKILRFTGEDPPLELWDEYPNWTNAWDEEGEDGQDETTLRPDAEQTFISGDTTFTAAQAILADGRSYPALAVIGNGELWSFNVYEGSDPWYYRHNNPENRWEPYAMPWLDEKDRPPVVSHDDAKIFPLKLALRLPWAKGEAPAVYEFPGNGKCRRLSENA